VVARVLRSSGAALRLRSSLLHPAKTGNL
jgi:hypothetical protein